MMPANRSIPPYGVIPVLPYPDLDQAVSYLCDAFGFEMRLRIPGHRAQLHAGDGAVIVRAAGGGGRGEVLLRVADVDAHHARACEAGVEIVRAPADHAYGERQYVARDFAGHLWTFSQSIADVAPESWGGIGGRL